MKEVTQSVTVPTSVELAPKLEELAGLGLQIVRSSRELQIAFQSDLSGSSASVCALLPVVLSNAQSCLSLLQFVLNQTPTSLPYVIHHQADRFLIEFSSQSPITFHTTRCGSTFPLSRSDRYLLSAFAYRLNNAHRVRACLFRFPR